MQTNPSHIFSLHLAPSKKSERYSSNSLQFIQSAIRLKVFKRIHFEVYYTVNRKGRKGDGGDLAGPLTIQLHKEAQVCPELQYNSWNVSFH